MKMRMFLLLVLVGLTGPACPRANAGRVPDGLDTSDWNSIRAEYERHRHAAFPVEGGHQARNFGQQWISEFDGHGFLVTPDNGDWKWGLELQSYGWAGRARAVTDRPRVTVETERVSYDWDENLREWYVNDGRGLEHGFTVRQPPAGQGETLELNLAVRGGLEPRVRGGGRAVAFVDADGRAVLIYAGLKVWDADGRALDARLEAVGGGLRLEVKADGARYPLTIDPTVQQAYLKASNTNTGDHFGYSVAISGRWRCYPRVSPQPPPYRGVNGNQGDNSVLFAGAAYVFVRDGAAWSQQAYLKASNTNSGDNFGFSVAISGDTAVVGAPFEDSNATGVTGNQGDNSVSFAGAADVFVREGGVWSQQAYLKASNTEEFDFFGFSVAISGDTVVVGAWQEGSNATGVNGNQRDNSALSSGAAYVFSVDQPSCVHSLSHSEEFFLANGGTGTVDVVTAADCSWAAISNTPFLTITSGASGKGNGTVSYAVDGNPSPSFRTGTLDIAGSTFTVAQEGTAADCVYFPSRSAEFFPVNGGTGTVDIVTAADCSWVAISNTPFLTILSGAAGTGNGTVSYAVEASPSASVRTGTVDIARLTFTVFQDGTTSLPEGNCVNIAGVWEGEESGTLGCALSAFGETETFSDSIDGSTSVMIQQAPGACSFSYDVSSPGGGTFPKSIRNGEINGYRLTFSGVAGIPLPGVTLSSNTMEGVGQVQGEVINISGFGVIKGTAPLPDFPGVIGNVSCTLTTTGVLTRSAKPPPLATSVVSGSSFLPGIVAGSWVTIFGEDFSDGVYLWGDAIIDGVLPTELGGVTVTINGKPAAIWFLRSGQINVQAPADDATGLVEVIVRRNGVSSAPFLADLRTYAPGFFRFDPEGRKYLASVHTDNTFIGKEGLFGSALTTRPVRPGDRVLLFGNGFGPTNPPTPTGVIPPVAPTVADVRITIGGIEAIVEFAGIVGAGLYQFNVIIPGGLAAGDAEVIAQVGGVQTPGGGFLTVGP